MKSLLSKVLQGRYDYRIQKELEIAKRLQKEDASLTRDQALKKAASIVDGTWL